MSMVVVHKCTLVVVVVVVEVVGMELGMA